MPEKFTPEEYEMLDDSPADAPHVVEGEPLAEDAPPGVVEGEDDGTER